MEATASEPVGLGVLEEAEVDEHELSMGIESWGDRSEPASELGGRWEEGLCERAALEEVGWGMRVVVLG